MEGNKKLLVPTSVGKVHVEPRAIPDLIHDTLSLQDGEMIRGAEKCVRDPCHPWSVHQQDCAALFFELPPAPEDNTLSTGCVPGF